jgi:2'-hydroxyisoflavone reductase
MDAVEGRMETYVFISSVSVFDLTEPGDRTDNAARVAARRGPEGGFGTYGGAKVACEDDVSDRLGAAATIVRPGIVAGPFDTSNRFTHWVRAAMGGGPVITPRRLHQPVQVVDCRDLAAFVCSLAERPVAGAFTAAGPEAPITIVDLVDVCASVSGTTLTCVPLSAAEVERKGLPALPFTVAESGDEDAFFQRDVTESLAAGLTLRPLEETARAVMEWCEADTEAGSTR